MFHTTCPICSQWYTYCLPSFLSSPELCGMRLTGTGSRSSRRSFKAKHGFEPPYFSIVKCWSRSAETPGLAYVVQICLPFKCFRKEACLEACFIRSRSKLGIVSPWAQLSMAIICFICGQQITQDHPIWKEKSPQEILLAVCTVKMYVASFCRLIFPCRDQDTKLDGGFFLTQQGSYVVPRISRSSPFWTEMAWS